VDRVRARSGRFCESCVAGGNGDRRAVVCPSSANGLVGLKPTVDWSADSGIIPISHSQDTAGPMARTVRDVAILLGAMAGADAEDSGRLRFRIRTMHKTFSRTTPNFLTLQAERSPAGVVRKYFGFNEAVDQVDGYVARRDKHAGAEIIDPADISTNLGKFDDSEMTVFCSRAKG